MRTIARSALFLAVLLSARGAAGLCGPEPELAEESPDVVLSSEVRAQAAALSFDPVRIYEFVRNDFEYQPYYGLMRGPEETLRARGGNEYDLGALLVSLLRVSEDADGNCVLSAAEDKNSNGVLDGGTRARFARGRVAIDPADAAEWTRTTTPAAAVEFLRWTEPDEWWSDPSMGVALYADRVERTQLWVEAEVPIARYRGSGLGGSGLAWIALDPSFKRKGLRPGIALPVGFDIDSYLGAVRQDTPLEAFERKVTQYLAANEPGKALEDVPIDGPIRREAPGVLPTALPYRVLAPGTVARSPSLIPLHGGGSSGSYGYRWMLDVARCSTSGCASIVATWSIAVPDVRGRSILVHAYPSSPTVTNPSESASICGAYSSAFVPMVSMGVGSAPLGSSATCGAAMPLRLSIRPPNPLPAWGSVLAASYSHPVVGGQYALALDTHSWTSKRVRELADSLIAARDEHRLEFASGKGYIETNGQAGKQSAELFYAAAFDAQKALTGGLLHLASAHYMRQTRASFLRNAGLHHRLMEHLPWIGLLEAGPVSAVILDTPFLVRPQQLLIDVRGVAMAFHDQTTGDLTPEGVFPQEAVLGMLEGSAREHITWEDLTAFEAISTVKGLQVRAQQAFSDPGGDLLTVGPDSAGLVIDDAGVCNSLDIDSLPICGGGPLAFAWAPSNLTQADVNGNTDAYKNLTCPGLSTETYCRIKNDVIFGNYLLGNPSSLPYAIKLCSSFGVGGCCQTPIDYDLPTFYFRALYWDRGVPGVVPPVCPTPSNPVAAASSLRIPRVARFGYQSWDGSVDFSYGTWVQWQPTVVPLGGFISAAITPYGSSPAGGGYPLYVADDLWGEFELFDSTTGTTHSYDDSFALAPLTQLEPVFSSVSNPALFVDSASSVHAGDPVNVFTGNYHQSDVDIAIPGRGGHDLRLTRSYNSRLAYDGPLGYGWIQTFDQHLRFEPNGSTTLDDDMVWVQETGGETSFDVLSEVQFAAPAWSHDELRRASPSSPYEIVTKTGMFYRFHPLDPGTNRARLDRIIDRNGNEITCEYADVQNPTRLTAVLDTAGRRLDFAYVDGRLRTVTDWTGRSFEYRVNADGDLEEFRNPVELAAGEPGVRFTYYNDLPGDRLDHNLRRIIQPEDRNGDGSGDVSIEFVYYLNDAVQSHTDSLGRTTSFTYNLFRRRTTVTHPDGTEEHYIFDGEGNVTRHESPRGVVHEYTFAASSHDRLSETDGLGFRTKASYDAAGNIIERIDRIESPNPNPKKETWTYNAFSQPLSYVDRRGARREWSYDPRGNLLEQRALVNGQMRVTRRHEYDGFGNRTKSTAFLEEDGTRPRTTRFFYAPNGVDLIRSVDANVHEMRLGVDALSRVTSVETTRSLPGTDAKDALLATTTYDPLSRPVLTIDTAATARRTILDANGNVEAVLTFVPTPAAPAAPVPSTVAACQALPSCRVDVRNNFDDADQVVAQTNALGETVGTEYDVGGRPVRITSPLGHETRFEYDEDGNRVRTIDPTGAESIAVYDAENRVVETRDALGRITSTSYDREGRVLEVKAPGNVTLATVLEYDAEGNPLRAENANGVESQATFDELGRRTLLREAVGQVDGQGNSVEAETLFAYDLEGKLVEKTDALGRTTRVHYDVLGRLSEVRSPLGHASSFQYDEVGNRTEITTPTGERIHFEYDSRGLVTRRYSSGGDPALAIDDTYAYDGLGRMTVARTASGTTRFFEYDALDRAVAMHDPAIGTVRQVFDADGRVVQIGYPDGRSVHYGYSARGEVTSVRDPAVAGLTTPLGDWQLAYDPLGRPVRERDPFGVERRTSYTEEGFVDRVEVHSSTALVESFVYSAYDDLGNPGSIASDVEGTTEIQYDPRSRVEKVAYPGGSLAACLMGCERFQYDKVGNRVVHAENGIEQRYQVDADDRLVEIEDAQGATLASFTHDAAGRRTGRSDTSASYAYDALGRLRSFQVGAFSGTLAYTATDERTLRTDYAGTTRYLGEWYETSGSTQRRLVHGPGVDNVLGQVSGTSQVRTLLRDGTANVVRTAADGAVTGARRWEAFGGSRGGPLAVERGFAGRPAEGSTSGGLINVRARHYDPATGSFLQPDPLGIAADQLYAYAANDPYRFADPMGLQPWSLASFFSNPSVAGSLQFAGGLGEAAVGAAACVSIVGCAVGAAAFVHGIDQAFAGASTLYNGQITSSFTSQALQAAGLSPVYAGYADAGIGVLSGVGAARSALGLGAGLAGGASAAAIQSAPQLVYRAGSRTPTNFTPRPGVDTTGLSTFDSLELAVQPGGKAQVIDTTRLQGLCAVCDAFPPGHVSIAPLGASTLESWAATRGTGAVHPHTQELLDAVVDEVRRPK